MNMSPAVWGMLILLSVVWGGTFFFQEIAVRELPVFTIVAVRVILAAAILLAVVAFSGARLPREWKVWRALFLLALINNVIPFCLIVWGQKEIASGLTSILNATTPIFTVLVAHFVTTDEKITGAKTLGVFAGFLGVAIVLGIDLLDGLGTAVIAQLAILGGALAYGFGAIFGRRFRAMGLTADVTATGQLMASCVILIPMALVVDAPMVPARTRNRHYRRPCRPRLRFNGAGLHPVFPYPGKSRRDQSRAGHVPDPGQRPGPRHLYPR